MELGVVMYMERRSGDHRIRSSAVLIDREMQSAIYKSKQREMPHEFIRYFFF